MNGATHNIIEDRGCEIRYTVFSGTLYACERWIADNTIEHPLKKTIRCRLDDTGNDLLRNGNGDAFTYDIVADNTEFSFQKGWFEVKQGQIAEVRHKIQAALGLTTRPAFYKRLNGVTIGLPAEREVIERIFSDYGITDIWGKV